MYMDDIMGVCWDVSLFNDSAIARHICNGLLGPYAIAEDETETGRRLDMLGNVVYIDKSFLSIARKKIQCARHRSLLASGLRFTIGKLFGRREW